MRYLPKTLIKMGCLLSLVGACSNAGTGTGGMAQNTPQTGDTTGAAGSTPSSTGGSTGSTAGKTGSTTTTGTTGGAAANTGTAGKPAGGTAGGGAQMMSGGAAGTAGGSSTGSGASCPGTGAALPAGACSGMTNGVYAFKVVSDVWFRDEVNDPPLFDPGRGNLTIFLRGEIKGVCDDGTMGVAEMHPCGTILPPIYADLAGGVVQIIFPDDLWEKPMIPTFTTMGSTSGFDPGALLTVAKTTSLVGISLTDIEATWPKNTETTTFKCAEGMGMACFPDLDGDMKPGISVQFQTTGTPPDPGYERGNGQPWVYINDPYDTSLNTAVGAKEVYIGLRTRIGGSGAIGSDCKSGNGAADVDDFESRVFDCTGADGMPCTPDQAAFVDQNTPAFHVLKAGATPPLDVWKFYLNPTADSKRNVTPSKGATSSVVRLGDAGANVSCADVRAAMYPAQ